MICGLISPTACPSLLVSLQPLGVPLLPPPAPHPLPTPLHAAYQYPKRAAPLTTLQAAPTHAPKYADSQKIRSQSCQVACTPAHAAVQGPNQGLNSAHIIKRHKCPAPCLHPCTPAIPCLNPRTQARMQQANILSRLKRPSAAAEVLRAVTQLQVSLLCRAYAICCLHVPWFTFKCLHVPWCTFKCLRHKRLTETCSHVMPRGVQRCQVEIDI